MSLKKISVSEVVLRTKKFFELKFYNLPKDYLISGELSNVRIVNGNCYFQLKDEQAQMRCIMWNSVVRSLPFKPEDGMKVLVRAAFDVYVKRGEMNLSVYSMQLDGLGELYLRLEELRKQLEAQGYFNPAHKKPRPAWIDEIGIVTGANTAALQDALKTIRTRWPMLKVRLYPASVQGEQAPAQIVSALKRADQDGLDAILLIRGGGSIEDLWCFNDPQIVETLYDMKTYTVTGVGHEIDTTLADYAADHRAVTPTAAAQWVTPDQKEVMASIESMRQSMISSMSAMLEQARRNLMFIQSSSALADPMAWVISRQARLDSLDNKLRHAMRERFFEQRQELKKLENTMNQAMQGRMNTTSRAVSSLSQKLLLHSPRALLATSRMQLKNDTLSLQKEIRLLLGQANASLERCNQVLGAASPETILGRGFAMIESDGKLVGDVSALHPEQNVSLIMRDGTAIASVESIKPKEKQ